MLDRSDTAEVGRALGALRRAARFPLVFGGIVVEERELRMSTLLGNGTDALRGLQVLSGRGLGGRALAARRPVAVGDYYASQVISHHFDDIARAESIRSMVAVPVIVRRRVRAVLYGAVRDTGQLGDVSVSAAVDAARDLEQELAIRDEVERRLTDVQLRASRFGSTFCPEDRDALRRGHAELRAVAGTVIDPDLRDRIDAVCETLAGRPRPQAPRLSQRERDVLACVAIGYSSAETAEALSIGSETVKSYLRSAMRKLDAHSRVQAVNAARAAGLLP